MNFVDYFNEQTERSVSSDDFSHQQDAYDAGVNAAWEALEEWLNQHGQVYFYELDMEHF